MAIPKIKATYTLDVESVRALERMARKWRTSKSEILRRMIRAGAREPQSEEGHDALAALDELQFSLSSDRGAVLRRQQEMRRERRSASAHRERRGR